MVCKKCQTEPVYVLTSNRKLCNSCFLKYFEKKVRKTIRIHKLINKGEKIFVAISGGKDSTSVLHILNKICAKNKFFELAAISIDEGIKDYRKKTIKQAQEFCKKNKIKYYVFSYKDEFGYSLNEMVKKLNIKPCTICGVLRRTLLNLKCRELGADKLVTGHNLDDEAQSILMNQFKRKINQSARLGPITGVKKDPRFVQRIKPLYLMKEKEVAIYAFLNGFINESSICPYSCEAFRDSVKKMLNNFENKYHGTKTSIITSFLEILPLLKKHYKKEDQINKCSVCKEPTSGNICQACQILTQLKD